LSDQQEEVEIDSPRVPPKKRQFVLDVQVFCHGGRKEKTSIREAGSDELRNKQNCRLWVGKRKQDLRKRG